MADVIRYSEAFKLQVVDEIGRGKHASLEAARRAYGIKGCETISKWLRKYGREDLLPKRTRIETVKEQDQLKKARKRIRELEAALADAHVDNCLEHAFLGIACDRLGTDLETFKKKNALTLSEVRKRREKNLG